MSEEEIRRRIGLAELRQAGPFVLHRRIQAGDVLLSRGPSLQSRLIAGITNGDFSHAAVWLPSGNSFGETLAEADGCGVGFTHLPLYQILCDEPRSNDLAYQIPGAPVRYLLVRHPEIKNISRGRLVDAAEKLQAKAFHNYYAALPDIIEAATMPSTLGEVARGVLEFAEWIRPEEGTRGAFCSELVALYFDELGLELVKDGRSASQISPNDLTPGRSVLKEVPQAFLDLEALKIVTYAYAPEYFPPERKVVLPGQIGHVQSIKKSGKAVDEFITNLKQTGALQFQESQKLESQIHQDIVESAEQALILGDLRRVKNFARLASTMTFLHVLNRQIRIVQVSMEEAADRKDLEAWGQAQIVLTEMYLGLRSQTQMSALRASTLMALSINRMRLNNRGASKIERLRTKAECRTMRRTMINGWTSSRAERRMTDRVLEAWRATEPPSTRAQQFIKDVVRDAEITALAESGT